jgi:hypothetical protein
MKVLLIVFLIILGIYSAGVLIGSLVTFEPILDIAESRMAEFGITMNMTIEEAAQQVACIDYDKKLYGYRLTGKSTVKELFERMIN